MNKNELMSTWELFLSEICRNVSPNKNEIDKSLNYLLKHQACSEIRYKAIVSVRYMAAYEQAINEYLHPPLDFKQANIKAELIHFGSLFEGLSEVLLVHLYKNKSFSLNDYKQWFPKQKFNELVINKEMISKKYKNNRTQALSFKAVIDCLSCWNKNKNSSNSEFIDFLRVIDALRKERNTVHVNQMAQTKIFHDEYRLVEVREKWLKFVKLIELEITS